MSNDKRAEEIVRRMDEIKARCDRATPGPWYADGWATWDDDAEEFAELQDTSADAQFIAHSREDIPYLLERIESLTAQLATKCAPPSETIYEQTRREYGVINLANLSECAEHREAALRSQLTASQQRERAAVEDLDALIKLVCEDGSGASCSFCADNDEDCHGDDPRWHCDDISGREWSGPQEAGEEQK